METTMNVTFGDKKSYDDWGLILTEYPNIEPPEPRTYSVEVPGGNGSVDLTEAFGGVTYEDRKLEFKFKAVKQRDDVPLLLQKIQAALHGKRMQIVLDSDPEYYYDARVTVDGYEMSGNNEATALYVDVSAVAYPFKIGADAEQTVLLEFMPDYVLIEGTISSLNKSTPVISFGTQNIPTHDFSLYSEIVLQATMLSGFAKVTVYAGESSHTFETDKYPINISADDITAAGLDPQKIYKFVFSQAILPSITGLIPGSAQVTLENGEMPSVPTFDSQATSVEGLIAIFNGKSYPVEAFPFSSNEIVLGSGENVISFAGIQSAKAFTVTERHAMGWL